MATKVKKLNKKPTPGPKLRKEKKSHYDYWL